MLDCLPKLGRWLRLSKIPSPGTVMKILCLMGQPHYAHSVLFCSSMAFLFYNDIAYCVRTSVSSLSYPRPYLSFLLYHTTLHRFTSNLYRRPRIPSPLKHSWVRLNIARPSHVSQTAAPQRPPSPHRLPPPSFPEAARTESGNEVEGRVRQHIHALVSPKADILDHVRSLVITAASPRYGQSKSNKPCCRD